MALDEIGDWSEMKLAIIRDYAPAYTRIVGSAKRRFHHVYVDAFAGYGLDVSRSTGKLVGGSPTIALQTIPRFAEYFLIDLDGARTASLRTLAGGDPSVHVREGDCNQILLDDVFPLLGFEDYVRALCFLDPYGLHLDWEVVRRAGHLRTVDLFVNFPVMDANRNVLWQRPEGVSDKQKARLDRWWGDRSWEEIVYNKQTSLFGEPALIKGEANAIVRGYRQRLKDVAGFAHVPIPIPMKNSRDNNLYWLFFASHNATGARIVNEIFEKYARRARR
jgi:three-Cys-motif partner protein